MTRCLLLAALAVALAVPADAQAPRYRIDATLVGSTCQYRIDGQTDQARFEVQPGDRLQLHGRSGTKARFDFVPDAGIAPLNRGSQTVDVQGNNETVTVRDARGADSSHEVIIQCCTERDGNRCNAWARATAASADYGARGLPLPGESVSGPAADVAPRPDPLLGPRMEVDE